MMQLQGTSTTPANEIRKDTTNLESALRASMTFSASKGGGGGGEDQMAGLTLTDTG
jgi:hypothetical protein